MNNPVVLWITNALGWSDPGFVIMWLTVLAIFLLYWIIRFLVVDLPFWIAGVYEESSGPGRLVIGLLLLIAVVVAFFVNFIVTVFAILGIIALAGSFRDWWHKGKS